MPGIRWPSYPGRWRQARSPPGSANRPLAKASPLCVINKLNGCKGWWILPDPSVASARMTRKVYHESGQSAHRSGCWNIPTFGKCRRALSEGLARFSRASKVLSPRFSLPLSLNHPVRSSNSICRSPLSSRGQFHPRHLPCRTKSHLRPSAIA